MMSLEAINGCACGKRGILNVMDYLDKIIDVHPLLIQCAPHAVQLGNVYLCQAAPVLAQVVHIQITDVLFVGPQLLQICKAQIDSTHQTAIGLSPSTLTLIARLLCISTPLASMCSDDGPVWGHTRHLCPHGK